jgi:hypothetical protein
MESRSDVSGKVRNVVLKKKCVSWTDRVRNVVVQRVKEEGNILQTTQTIKANRSGDILCKSCILRYVTEGKTEGSIEVTRSRRKRSKKLPDDPKEKKRGYWKLKEEVLVHTL